MKDLMEWLEQYDMYVVEVHIFRHSDLDWKVSITIDGEEKQRKGSNLINTIEDCQKTFDNIKYIH